MTIKALYPTVRPTLNLDFAKTKALDPRVTFTRASTATFVGADGLIKTAASGAARFDHNPETGESLGLLVEEARTNTIVSSSVFNTGAWTQDGAVLTANAGVAPDGTTTATSISQGTGSNRCYLFDNSGVTGSKVFSFFVKANAGTSFQISATGGLTPNATATVNLSSVTVSGFTSATIQAFANGWYRVLLPVTVSTASGGSTYWQIFGPVSSVFIWGFQLEAGSFPTSYIPTTTATVTRAADVASMTGTNFSSWWNGSKQGTLFFNHDLTPETQSATNSNSMIVAFADGLYAYGNVIGYWGSGTARFLTTNFYTATPAEAYNSGNFPSYGVTLSNPGYDKYALAYTPGSGLSKAAINGVLLPAISTPSAYIPTAFYFGGTHTQRIARLAYYPVRLPDAQLQAITAT